MEDKIKEAHKELQSFFFKTGERIVIGGRSSQHLYLVNPAELMCIIAEQNYTQWLLSDGSEFTIICQLGDCIELINEQIYSDSLTLARIGRSAIINFNYITELDMTKKQVVISNRSCPSKESLKKEITVSEEVLKKLKEAIILYKESNENK